MANIIIDAILVIILVIGFIWGIKSGFVKTVSKPAKLVMTIVLSIWLASTVGDTIIKPIISEPVVNKLAEYLTLKCNDLPSSGEEFPTIIKLAASLAGVDISEIASEAGQAAMVEAVVEAVTNPILSIISAILAFVILYIVFKIVLGIVFGIINSIVDNGIVGVVNKVLGCIVMTFLAATVVWCLCGLSDFILNLPLLQEQEWLQGFTGGYVYNFFKSISPIDLMLNLLLSF